MISNPIEFYNLLDTLEIDTLPEISFKDHVEQVSNAMQAYQQEYDLTDEKVIEILESVIKISAALVRGSNRKRLKDRTPDSLLKTVRRND